jgi:hypothetical protein
MPYIVDSLISFQYGGEREILNSLGPSAIESSCHRHSLAAITTARCGGTVNSKTNGTLGQL